MPGVEVLSRTQRIIVQPKTSVVGVTVLSRVQRIILEHSVSVSVINAGPIGPRGSSGPQGNSGSNIDDALIAHIASLVPHSTYDDIVDLTTLLENGLF